VISQVWIIDKQNRILDKIVGRRKKRRSFEYEVRPEHLLVMLCNSRGDDRKAG